MKCKCFNIRVKENIINYDEIELNDFINKVDVKQISASLVKERSTYWSILVFYDYKKQQV